MIELLTNSRMNAFRKCPWMHYLQYERGIVPVEKSAALRFGSLYHETLEAIDKGLPVEPIYEGQDPYLVASVRAVIAARTELGFGLEHCKTVATELEFSIPLQNPDTGRSTSNFLLCGKIDQIIELPDGRLAMRDYKTTSRDFSPGADYWVKLRLDQQLSIYMLGARAIGYDIKVIIYDVAARPKLIPLKATPEDKRKYKKDGTLYANQRAEDETPQEYGDRIYADIMNKASAGQVGKCFSLIEVARTADDLKECGTEVWQTQKMIRMAQREGYWFRNPGACFSPYQCAYLPICLNKDVDTLPAGFMLAPSLHPELEGETNG